MKTTTIVLIISYLSIISCTRPVFSFDNPQGAEVRVASVYYIDTNDTYHYVEGVYDTENAVVYAKYSPQLEKVGWDFLTISTNMNASFPDHVLGYAFGYIEGIITQKRIYPFYQNMIYPLFGNGSIPQNVADYFAKFDAAFANNSYKNSRDGDPYWVTAYTIHRQFFGLLDGYNLNAEEDEKLTSLQLHILVSNGDISDVENYNDQQSSFFKKKSRNLKPKIKLENRCSCLFKALDDFSDVIFGHNTWYSLSGMSRIFKEYRFQSQNKIEKSKSVVFSSYPGTLTSIDDFYITDQNLAITETTLVIGNQQIYSNLNPETQLLYWVRNIIANRLATDAESWTQIFSKYNSGTYNNQFMVLDMKKVDLENQIIHDNAFWISEQTPGLMRNQDVTRILRFGYWPSYNQAYSQEIAKRINQDIGLYSNTPRANIFRRDQGNVTDVESFMKLIRSNNWETDPLSLGFASHQISSRYDLNPPEYQACWGGLDSKVGSVKALLNSTQKKIRIISGPTHEDEPVFVFSKSVCALQGNTNYGNPDVWDFEWMDYETTLFDN